MKEKTAELKEKIEKDYRDMMEVINSTSLPLFVEDTIEDMHILIENLIAENKELKEENKELEEELEKEKEKNKELEVEFEIKKYCKVNELASDLVYYKNLAREYQGNCVSKDKIKPIQIIDLDGKIHNVYKLKEE